MLKFTPSRVHIDVANFAPKDDLLECSPLSSVHGSLFELGKFGFVNIMLHMGAPKSVSIVMNDLSDSVS
eukprot:14860636-Heterocapsa_arctica.AAC.1